MVTTVAPAWAADAPALETKSILVTLSPPEVHLKAVEGKYDLITIPGADLLIKPGYPILPCVTVTLTLPPGVELASVDVSAEYEVLEGKYRIAPGPEPRPLGPPWLNDTRLRYEAEPYPAVYSSMEFLPTENFTYSLHFGLNVETMRDATFLAVRLFPVKYSPALGEVRFAREMRVTVTYRVQKAPVQTYDKSLVIITNSTLLTAANDLAAARQAQGWSVLVVTTDGIDANYTGGDLQEEIRSFIADKRAEGYAFFLILGDADQVPVRLAYIPDGYDDSDNPDYSGDGSFVETDLYYSDLQGTWDSDGDGLYGELGEVDGVPDVLLGRLPASTLSEAQAMVSKVVNYSPDSSWFYRFLFVGTVTFDDALHPEGEYLNDVIEYQDLPDQYHWVKLYDQLNNLSPSSVQEQINTGYGFVNFAGHGDPNGWYSGPLYGYRTVYSSSWAASLNNSTAPAIVVTMACMTARFVDVDSIGEVFVKNPDGGAVAYFGATRVAWGYGGFYVDAGLAGKMDRLFVQELLSAVSSTDLWVGAAHSSAIAAYVLTLGISDVHDWKTVAEYGTLLGDPTLELLPSGVPPTPTPEPKLYGHVTDSNGLPVGGATVSLYNYDTGALLAQTTTGADGYYEIPRGSIPPVAARLRVSETPTTQGGVKTFYLVRDQFRVDMSVLAKGFPPNTVLFVVDDDGSGQVDVGVWPDEIAGVISSLGFNVVVYRESEYGEPTLDILLEAVAVFWHVGTYYGEAISASDADLLIQYVKRGGSLVVEGEDIAYDHGSDRFMTEVAHAVYEVDNADSAGIDVTLDHFLTSGLPASFTFNVTPPFPDGVSPHGGFEFLRYTGTPYSAAVAYDGIGGNGSRVVYFAFPLHYLNSTHRETLVRNAILWVLGGDSTTPVVLADLPHVLEGKIRVNLTVVHPDGISSVGYGVDGDPTTPTQVVDGSADEAREDVFIELGASSLAEGEHVLTIQVRGASGNLSLSFRVYVVHLQEKWTMISVAEPTRDNLTAKDLGMAIGEACGVVARWDPATGRYYSYLPGISPDDYDFLILRGYGYFVFLGYPAPLAWIEGQESVNKEGWA